MNAEVNRKARREIGPEADLETSTISLYPNPLTIHQTPPSNLPKTHHDTDKKDNRTMNNQNSLIVQQLILSQSQ